MDSDHGNIVERGTKKRLDGLLLLYILLEAIFIAATGYLIYTYVFVSDRTQDLMSFLLSTPLYLMLAMIALGAIMAASLVFVIRARRKQRDTQSYLSK